MNTGIVRLTEHQLKALNNFVCGKDSFVCLPTGHGKSLIYQLCPVVVKELSSSGLEQFPTGNLSAKFANRRSDRLMRKAGD